MIKRMFYGFFSIILLTTYVNAMEVDKADSVEAKGRQCFSAFDDDVFEFFLNRFNEEGGSVVSKELYRLRQVSKHWKNAIDQIIFSSCVHQKSSILNMSQLLNYNLIVFKNLSPLNFFKGDNVRLIKMILPASFPRVENLPNHLAELFVEGDLPEDKSVLFAKFHQWTSLKTLSLSVNEITSEEMKQFVDGLKKLTHLEVLHLRGNYSLSLEQARMLVQGLESLKNLKDFRFDWKIGLEATKLLADGLQNCELNVLRLNALEKGIFSAYQWSMRGMFQKQAHLKTLSLQWVEPLERDEGVELAEVLKPLVHLEKLELQVRLSSPELLHAGFRSKDELRSLARSLQNFSQLKEFVFTNHNIENSENAQILADLLSNFSHLEVLKLGANFLGSVGMQRIAGSLQKLQALQILDLNANSLGLAGAQALVGPLKELQALQALNLDSNSLGGEGIQVLASSLVQLKELKILNLNFNAIEAEDAPVLAEVLRELESLEILHLGFNHLGDAGVEILADVFSNLKFLKDFDLGSNFLSHRGLQILMRSLSNSKKLRRLNVRSNDFGFAGARILSKYLPVFRELQELDLLGNQLGEDGARVLVAPLGKLPLLRLNLCFNQLSFSSVLMLKNSLKKLQVLDLSNNPLALGEGEEICAMLENVTVILKH